MFNPRKTFTLAEAISKLQSYCMYQERCHKEVEHKLQEMRMSPQAKTVIMALLIREDLLNEERFARAFARGKFRIKNWGRSRIIAELQQRNISKYNIKNALDEIDEQLYKKTFDALALKRLAQIKEPSLQKKRKKLADYLLSRGWETHLVYEKVKEVLG